MELQENEYYVLLVQDYEKDINNRTDYTRPINVGYGKNSDGLVYISKDYAKIRDAWRGIVLSIRVDDLTNFQVL